jgi:hypothetical protein
MDNFLVWRAIRAAQNGLPTVAAAISRNFVELGIATLLCLMQPRG